KQGGVFALLNDPARWEGMVKAGQAALERARALAARAGGPVAAELTAEMAALHNLLQDDDRERLLAQRLEKVRLDRSTWTKQSFASAAALQEYPRAFLGAGLDVLNGDPQDLAARIRSSPLREHLVAALDDWAWTAVDRKDKSLKLTQRLLEVARQADPSPWTDQLRDTRLWLDWAALTKLTAEAPVERLSPPMLTLVSQLLRSNDLDAAAWLRQ